MSSKILSKITSTTKTPVKTVDRLHGLSTEYRSLIPVPPLNSFLYDVQHNIIVRELLSALCGIEGEYIRIAAPVLVSVPGVSKSASSIRVHNESGPYMRPIHFVMDADSADKSLVSQVGELLQLCESIIYLKDFARVHARYEYGLVSHAFAAALRNLLQDYETVIIQLECLLVRNNLTLQKMVYFLQPSKVIVRCLEKLCRRI